MSDVHLASIKKKYIDMVAIVVAITRGKAPVCHLEDPGSIPRP